MRRFWAAMLTVAMGAAVLVAAPAPAAASDSGDTVGFVDPETGRWYLQENDDSDLQENDDYYAPSFYYGNPGDYPFMGDWNCDGVDTPGLYRQSDGYVYLRNSNTQGIADVSFFFGNPGDVPIAGDFDADGCDTVSIYRPSEQRFYVINQLGTSDGGLGAAEYSFIFGNPGDKPFVGDFNGNEQDTIGLHRESTGLVYFRNTNTTGVADNQFFFGDPGDRFMAGDWTGDGIDTPGLFRPSNRTTYLRYTNTQGNADEAWPIGESNWLPVAGLFFNCDNQTSIPTKECEALVTVYNSTGGVHWGRNRNWLTDPNPCTWMGVVCDEGSVTQLGLLENYLIGSIPPEIGDLPHLRSLDMEVNGLEGPIPPEIGKLTDLESLWISGNQLSGPIPAEIGSLSSLATLHLGHNQISGPIPAELGNLSNLKAMGLSGNNISGPIPTQLGNLTNLRILRLDGNQLDGPIPPQLGNLTLLEVLGLSSNRLYGPVPLGLANLNDLWQLALSGQTGCLTAATPTLASWLSSFDPYWNDGCAG